MEGELRRPVTTLTDGDDFWSYVLVQIFVAVFLERGIFTQGERAHSLKFTSAIPFHDMTSGVTVKTVGDDL